MTLALLFTAFLAAGADQNKKIIVGERLSQAEDLIHYVKPRCPAGIHSSIPFVIQVKAIIDSNCKLRNLEFLNGDPRFRKESLRVLSLWKYKPVTIQGRKVEPITVEQLTYMCPGHI